MAKSKAPEVVVVSEGPPKRSLVEILQDPPKLHLAGPGKTKTVALSATVSDKPSKR